MDLVIELDNEGRIWVSGSDGTARAEAWLHGAHETSDALRASGLCLLEEKYTPGIWTSTSHSAPPRRRSTYFPRSIFSTHSHTQQCYVVVA